MPGSGASVVSGFAVGDVAVVRTPGVGVQNYLAQSDGLLPITQLQANLLASDHATTRDESLSWYAAQPASRARENT